MIESLLLLIKMMGCSPLMDSNNVTIKDSDTIHGPGYLMKDTFGSSDSAEKGAAEEVSLPSADSVSVDQAADGGGSISVAPTPSESAVSGEASSSTDISPYATDQLEIIKKNLKNTWQCL